MTANRLLLFFALMLLHIAAAVVYFLYTQTQSADTTLYYYDSIHMARYPFQLGTIFTVKFAQTMKQAIGGSYLDYFLIFQAFGFWGIALLMRSFEEIHALLNVQPTALTNALLFLPGMHFWTSAIGKDAPLYFAICLAVWSMLALRRRLVPFAIALSVMVLFRPHIALVTVMSVAMAAVIDGRTSTLAKIGLITFSLAAAAVIATTVESTFDVRISNANSVADFFARKIADFSKISGGTAVHGASFPFRMFSLLFRPFFIDANGIFAMFASLENAAFVAMLLFTVHTRHEARHLLRSVFFLKFAVIFACLLTVLLTMVYYNVGLGLRQRVMFMPALLCFFAAQWAYHQRVKAAPVAPVEAIA